MITQEDHQIVEYNENLYRCTECGKIEQSKKAIKTYCCTSVLEELD